MPDFHQLLMRHGECWLQDIVEQIERNEGMRTKSAANLEERWNALMLTPDAQSLSPAA